MKATFIIFLASILATDIVAQDSSKPRPSPTAITSARYKDTYIKITYCQPQKRNRVIFGELVPFGQVWRTGANEATEITLTKDILINNTNLKAGTYSLFTIPNKDKWTIIINSATGLWGAYQYNDKLDAIRFDVIPQQIKDDYEAFTIWFDEHNEMADLQLAWDKTKVTLPIKYMD